MSFKNIPYILSLLVLLTGCGSRSMDDYKEEGKGVTRSLIEELKQIQNRDDLLEATPDLNRLFSKLAEIMVQAQSFANSHPNQTHPEVTREDRELSDQLRFQLNRIYQLEGGRETIEKCQTAALKQLENIPKNG